MEESLNPSGFYLLKVDNRNSRTRCKIYSKLTIKMPERRQWRRSGIFIVNFERVSIVNFEQLNAGWDYPSIISIKG